MSAEYVPLAIIMFVFTYPSRAVGLLAPAIDRLPRQVLAYLQLVGPAVLAALAAVDIMVGVENGESYFTIGLPWLSVGACIALVWWRKNLFLGLAAAIAIAIVGRGWGSLGPDQRSGGPRPRSRRASSARSGPATSTRVEAGRSRRRARRGRHDRRRILDRDDVHPGPDDVGSVKPASRERRSMIARRARAWAPRRRDGAIGPSGPASVVPLTQQVSPTTTARL